MRLFSFGYTHTLPTCSPFCTCYTFGSFWLLVHTFARLHCLFVTTVWVTRHTRCYIWFASRFVGLDTHYTIHLYRTVVVPICTAGLVLAFHVRFAFAPSHYAALYTPLPAFSRLPHNYRATRFLPVTGLLVLHTARHTAHRVLPYHLCTRARLLPLRLPCTLTRLTHYLYLRFTYARFPRAGYLVAAFGCGSHTPRLTHAHCVDTRLRLRFRLPRLWFDTYHTARLHTATLHVHWFCHCRRPVTRFTAVVTTPLHVYAPVCVPAGSAAFLLHGWFFTVAVLIVPPLRCRIYRITARSTYALRTRSCWFTRLLPATVALHAFTFRFTRLVTAVLVTPHTLHRLLLIATAATQHHTLLPHAVTRTPRSPVTRLHTTWLPPGSLRTRVYVWFVAVASRVLVTLPFCYGLQFLPRTYGYALPLRLVGYRFPRLRATHTLPRTVGFWFCRGWIGWFTVRFSYAHAFGLHVPFGCPHTAHYACGYRGCHTHVTFTVTHCHGYGYFTRVWIRLPHIPRSTAFWFTCVVVPTPHVAGLRYFACVAGYHAWLPLRSACLRFTATYAYTAALVTCGLRYTRLLPYVLHTAFPQLLRRYAPLRSVTTDHYTRLVCSSCLLVTARFCTRLRCGCVTRLPFPHIGSCLILAPRLHSAVRGYTTVHVYTTQFLRFARHALDCVPCGWLPFYRAVWFTRTYTHRTGSFFNVTHTFLHTVLPRFIRLRGLLRYPALCGWFTVPLVVPLVVVVLFYTARLVTGYWFVRFFTTVTGLPFCYAVRGYVDT